MEDTPGIDPVALASGSITDRRARLEQCLTIFDAGGIPVTNSCSEAVEDDILNGGFFAAVSEFVRRFYHESLDKLVMGARVILLRKSSHYIGAFAWTADLGIPEERCVRFLDHLLVELERTCPWVQKQQVARCVNRYLVHAGF